ncbi:MAG: hypothetical protein EON56_03840 [Alphaproteobacteria bacterium]|nr:MAG: hypothetical protein EON56_03840 [Alphaproteobacteria bacterium]
MLPSGPARTFPLDHGAECTRSAGLADNILRSFESGDRHALAEHLYAAQPALASLANWGVRPEIRRTNVVFIHVPRAAGTSIATALYGRPIWHRSVRVHLMRSRSFFDQAHSFAVLRDPFDRVQSCYAYVMAGGAQNRLNEAQRKRTAHLKSMDDYLSHVADYPPLQLDCVMRSQTWFVCDLNSDRPLVKDLFVYGRDDEALGGYLAKFGVSKVPRLNASDRTDTPLTVRQRSRIETLYRSDFELIAAVGS